MDARKLSTAELVELLNTSAFAVWRREANIIEPVITETAVGKWVRTAGCPHSKKGNKRIFNLVDVCAWLIVERKSLRGSAETSGDNRSMAELEEEKLRCDIDLTKVRIEHERIKAELNDYKRRVQDGELIEASEVEAGQLARARYIRDTLERLPDYAGRLQSLPLQECRDSLGGVARALLRTLSNTEETDET